jgi:hypothetical protein
MKKSVAAFITMWLVLLEAKLHGQTHELADSLWGEADKAVEMEDFLKAAELFELSALAELKYSEPREEDLFYEWRKASYYYHQATMYS